MAEKKQNNNGMMSTVAKEVKDHKGAAIGIAAGIAAAAAGAYFLYGSKNAKKYRGKLKSWMFSAKGEILAALEKLENVSEQQYHQIVDAVAARYQNVEADDIKRFVTDMKKHWVAISKTKKSGARTKAAKKGGAQRGKK